MFTSTFTFAPGTYDDEFHALDARIADMARAIPGYLGEETWENATTGLVSNVYYWDSMAAMQQLIGDAAHREAKQAQAKWLKGYQVVIAEVLRSYGDAGIPHPLKDRPVR